MHTRQVRIRLVAILAMVLWFPVAHADHVRVESEVFAGASLTGGADALTQCQAPVNIGDVCFAVLPGETSADLLVRDVAQRDLAAVARLYDADFAFLASSGSFCGFMDNLGIHGAAYVVVQPLDPVNARVACDQVERAVATVGTVTAGFH